MGSAATEKENRNKMGKKSKRMEKEKQKETEGREKVSAHRVDPLLSTGLTATGARDEIESIAGSRGRDQQSHW
jgi:hypothetical protein